MAIKEVFLGWGMLVLSVLFNVYGVFAVKMKLNELGPIKFDSFGGLMNYFSLAIRSGAVIAGVILFFAAPFLFAVALSRMEITVAYPVQIILSLIILSLLAVLFMGEHLTVNKIIVMILAVLCVYLLRK